MHVFLLKSSHYYPLQSKFLGNSHRERNVTHHILRDAAVEIMRPFFQMFHNTFEAKNIKYAFYAPRINFNVGIKNIRLIPSSLSTISFPSVLTQSLSNHVHALKYFTLLILANTSKKLDSFNIHLKELYSRGVTVFRQTVSTSLRNATTR